MSCMVANQSMIAAEALGFFARLYGMQREAQALKAGARRMLREQQARPIEGELLGRLEQKRSPVLIDNNWIENKIRPIAIGRKNWLFAGSLRAGRRAAAIMSLIQLAKLNGVEQLACLTDVLTRRPTHPNKRIAELLPHRWSAEMQSGQQGR